jgi:hypothetical protein
VVRLHSGGESTEEIKGSDTGQQQRLRMAEAYREGGGGGVHELEAHYHHEQPILLCAPVRAR